MHNLMNDINLYESSPAMNSPRAAHFYCWRLDAAWFPVEVYNATIWFHNMLMMATVCIAFSGIDLVLCMHPVGSWVFDVAATRDEQARVFDRLERVWAGVHMTPKFESNGMRGEFQKLGFMAWKKNYFHSICISHYQSSWGKRDPQSLEGV